MVDVNNLLNLDGKVAIVTGAATGIGAATAEIFAAAGAKTAGGDVNTEALAGHDFLAFHQRLDVSDQDSVNDFFAAVERELGGVDIVINVAGIYPFRTFEEMDVETWDKVQAVNTRGTFLVDRAAVEAMKKRGGGAIVNISSVGSKKAVITNNIHYGASKAGVNAITISIALEQAEHGIRCNAILPGAIATEQAAKATALKTPAGPFTQPGRIPLTGMPTGPESIGYAALFLASDASSYVNGQLLAVDGGFLVS